MTITNRHPDEHSPELVCNIWKTIADRVVPLMKDSLRRLQPILFLEANKLDAEALGSGYSPLRANGG